MAITKLARRWTYEDLFSLPEGKRYEIIDGELFEMPSPAAIHALVLMSLIARFLPLVTSLRGSILTAPLDVFMAGANPVQPDILVLLPDRLDLISTRGIEGAPDLVVEILSPSNPRHDRVTKRELYARGGVREYWLVSPEAAIVEVLVLGEDGAYRTHVRAGGDELVSSVVLPDLGFPASEVFPS